MGVLCSNSIEYRLNSTSKDDTKSLNIIYSLKKNPKYLYENQRIIGKGTSSCVYLVKHNTTKQERALKEIRKSAIDFSSRNSVRDEIMILSSLVLARQDHPNIVKVFEVIDTSNFIYITSEYMNKGILLNILQEHETLFPSQIREFIYDILCAINYCHKKGIIHSELKPENLLFSKLNGKQIVKINDFSTSRIASNTASKLKQAGIIYFMSPEQFEGEISEKSDIWSLGVIMYLMFCIPYSVKALPFFGDTLEGTVEKIKYHTVSLDDELFDLIDPQIKDLLLSLLSKNPEGRPTAEAALNNPWFEKMHQKKPDKDFRIRLLKNLVNFTVFFRQSLQVIVKKILRVICYHNSNFKIDYEVADFFKYIDRNSSGDISREDLEFAFTDTDLREDLDKVITSLNPELKQYLTYSDFVAATVNWREELTSDMFIYLKEICGSENISSQDLRKITPNANIEEIVKFFNEVDSEKKGTVTVSQLYEKVKSEVSSMIVNINV